MFLARSIVPEGGFVWRSDNVFPSNEIGIPRREEAKPPYLVPVSKMAKITVFDPIITQREVKLYQKFAQLKPDKNEILKFANQYGLPKWEYVVVDPDSVKHPYELGSEEDPTTIGLSFWEWQKEIVWMVIFVTLLKKIVEEDYMFFEDFLRKGKDYLELLVPIDCLPDWVNEWIKEDDWGIAKFHRLVGIGVLKRFKNNHAVSFNLQTQNWSWFSYAMSLEDPIEVAKLLIVDKINNRYFKDGFRVSVILNRTKNKLEQKVMPKNLLVAMYQQYLADLLGQRKLRECAYCGRLFEVTDKRQMYCSFGHCKEYYFREKKKVLQLYKEGKTIEEIAKLLNRPIEKIQVYLKEKPCPNS
ncbi:hypothetical protein ELD05_04035 [Caldicellulosiruptor changbaiensis]|uniref:Uncharacterized protein n=1 Tax=Caldicellulosiruptor changbaiensis TaxID=1222016 RepID=A0A3T0D4C8_9FIRM|nr:hypothetical protein [Caldicellulosiruptor changbaiensis]AZT89893.1 hypothetical protein ELD05_04035 [Caldicellulosiruptor changbaiensis]